jgi:hypothetical protein
MTDEIYSITEDLRNYSVSNYGNVLNKSTGQTLKHALTPKDGHVVYLVNSGNLKKRKIALHRLVAFIYVNNPKGDPFVRHKDGNKDNNHYTNLEWFNKGMAPDGGFHKKYASINL